MAADTAKETMENEGQKSKQLLPWNIPLPDSPPQPPLRSDWIWGTDDESPLSSRSQTPSEPEWEDLPAPALGSDLVLDDDLLTSLTS